MKYFLMISTKYVFLKKQKVDIYYYEVAKIQIYINRKVCDNNGNMVITRRVK